MTVPGRSRIAELLAANELTARRSLGQNFVVDPSVIDRIVAVAGVGPGDHVVEIGPGLGSLTVALAATGAEVVAIEKDAALVGVLEEVLAQEAEERADAPGVVSVVTADAQRVDWPTLLGDAPSWVLVANLPYNVAVPILSTVLECAPMVDRLVIMVQEEVGERLAARPGGRTIGIPSITTAWFASAEIVATVGPDAFLPRPRVTSVVVELTRRPPPREDVEPERAFSLAATAYRQRRKMLRSSLSGRRWTRRQFEAAGIAAPAGPRSSRSGSGPTGGVAAAVDGSGAS